MQLLAGADPLAGPGVQVVVDGAQGPDAGQRGERREGRRVRAAAQEEVDPEDDATMSRPPIVGVPSLT